MSGFDGTSGPEHEQQQVLLQIQAEAILDTGGSVVPKQTCCHVFSRYKLQLDQLAESMRRPCCGCGSVDENWVCLECNQTLCSRYVMGHAVEHWEDTMMSEADPSRGGHCLVLSLSDLSVWCYACNEYVKHDRLLPLLVRAEAIKFETEEKAGMLRGVQWDFSTGLCYDAETEAHERRSPPCFERPQRTTTVWARLQEHAVLAKCRPVTAREATTEELSLVHTSGYLSWLSSLATDAGARAALPPDLYATPHTPKAARLSCGSALALLESWRAGTIKNGMALTRPPGHHAGPSSGSGFCFLNNVAVTARVAQRVLGLSRSLIVDWDIHHGNGTQEVFYEDGGVCVVSLHRQKYKAGELEVRAGAQESDVLEFEQAGRADKVGGSGAAAGRNVNVALTSDQGVGDADYLEVFRQVVVPVAREYKPELVLVSAGFDAAAADEHLPVGGYRVTPEGYACMTQELLNAAEGTGVLLCLEGGYNAPGLAANVEACMMVLLGHAPSYVPVGGPREQTLRDIEEVRKCHAPYWACFRTATSSTDHP